MWGDITLAIATSVGEAICVNLINKKKSDNLKAKLGVVVSSELEAFADTSLDCREFYQLVKSSAFTDLLKNMYCSTQEDSGVTSHLKAINIYIRKTCPKVNELDSKRFVQAVERIYEHHLKAIISGNSELSALFQAITITNKRLANEIKLEEEKNFNKYINYLREKGEEIKDSEIAKYHELCKSEYGFIRFTGISGAENKPAQDINSFYVKNTFSCYYTNEFHNEFIDDDYDDDNPETIKLEDLFRISNKVVIIGAAGLGKSTTLNYIFCNYESLYDSSSLKIKINLKEYATEINDNNKDLLWCIASEFCKRINRTKWSFEEIESQLTKYLELGKCLVILDALDEIPTQPRREKVRDTITIFCNLFYLNRYIITTREVGYLKNGFDNSFFHLRINNFDIGQIEQYSKKWFSYNYQNGNTEEFWNDFNKEVERAKCDELIRNPIVLVLALNIFDIEKNLPNRRVEFYKKCIETFLVIREDRKVAVVLSEKTKNILHMDSVVPRIAHYLQSHLEQDADYKLNHEQLKKSVYDAIEINDELNWGEAVNSYLSYLINRTELIIEKDEDIYDFAHKTFYEYFLAVYYSKEYTVEQLIELLNKWIGDSNNDELARLIIEVVIQKDDQNQHDSIIRYLLSNLNPDSTEMSFNAFEKFQIVSGLYSDNMLKPKFHYDYHEAILLNPKLIDRSPLLFTYGRKKYPYDSKLLAQLFYEQAINNNNLPRFAADLWFLSAEFCLDVISLSDNECVKNMLQLFEIVRFPASQNSYVQECTRLIDYFLSSELKTTLETPLVYISLICVSAYARLKIDCDKLLNYKFASNSMFFEFSYGFTNKLFSLASKSKYYFLLTFIILTVCCNNETRDFIRYLKEKYRHQKKNYLALEWLNECLLSNTLEDRIAILDKNGVYIPEQIDLYRDLFCKFDEQNKHLRKMGIQGNKNNLG